jgi:2-oxoglutarate dehydrogenase E2 component (dihydrolipoamide succinyltransferase)
MEVIAALGDAPTAAIAVVAIGVGLFLAARGPREKRAGAPDDTGEAPGPAMVTLPAGIAAEPEAEPDAEPGFVGPAGEIVGHGPIRLGVHGPLGAEPAPDSTAVAEPVPAAPTLPVPAPAPALMAEAPAAAPEAPAAAPEAPLFESPSPALPDEPAHKEPAWRVAARAANSAVHFRQGTIKLGGKPVDKRDDG